MFPVLWSSFVAQVGASHWVTLIAPFLLDRIIVQEKVTMTYYDYDTSGHGSTFYYHLCVPATLKDTLAGKNSGISS